VSKRYKNVGTSVILDGKFPGQEFSADLDPADEGFLISIGALEVLSKPQSKDEPKKREGGKR